MKEEVLKEAYGHESCLIYRFGEIHTPQVTSAILPYSYGCFVFHRSFRPIINQVTLMSTWDSEAFLTFPARHREMSVSCTKPLHMTQGSAFMKVKILRVQCGANNVMGIRREKGRRNMVSKRLSPIYY